MFVDARPRVIEYAGMFFGSTDGAEAHPREVVKAALHLPAAALIVGHNHPSGVTDASAANRAVTARLKQALAWVDVRLLDHIIVGGNSSLSMAGAGFI